MIIWQAIISSRLSSNIHHNISAWYIVQAPPTAHPGSPSRSFSQKNFTSSDKNSHERRTFCTILICQRRNIRDLRWAGGPPASGWTYNMTLVFRSCVCVCLSLAVHHWVMHSELWSRTRCTTFPPTLFGFLHGNSFVSPSLSFPHSLSVSISSPHTHTHRGDKCDPRAMRTRIHFHPSSLWGPGRELHSSSFRVSGMSGFRHMQRVMFRVRS